MGPETLQRTKTYFDWAANRGNFQSREEVLKNGKYVQSLGRVAGDGAIQLFIGVYFSDGKPIHEEYQERLLGVTIERAIASGLTRGREIGRVSLEDLEGIVKSFKQYNAFIEGCSGRVKLASKSALLHIEMAVKISEIDPLMALFRSVCAEEEAATALISSLKNLRYKGVEKIQFKSHQDKQAVIIFIKAVKTWYVSYHAENFFGFDNLRLHPCKVDKREAFGIHVPIQSTSKSAFIEPPLNLKTANGLRWADVICDGVNAIAAEGGFSKLPELIKERANFRNHILYASDKSLPGWDGEINSYILNQAGMVGSLIRALGLIDPWSPRKYQHSELVEACIEVFLKLMKPERPPK